MFPFACGNTKHKFFREPLCITFYGLIHGTRRNLIQCHQVEVEHHALAADFVDFILDKGYIIHKFGLWGLILVSAVIRIFLITRFAADFRALFLALLRIVADLRRADPFHDVAQTFDFRQQRVDVLFGDFEVGIIPGFDISPLQEVEKPFFFRCVARECFEYFGREPLTAVHKFGQIVFLWAI